MILAAALHIKCGAGVTITTLAKKIEGSQDQSLSPGRFNNFKIAREYIAVTNSKAFVRIDKEVYAQDK
jgi:hypothetical protein